MILLYCSSAINSYVNTTYTIHAISLPFPGYIPITPCNRFVCNSTAVQFIVEPLITGDMGWGIISSDLLFSFEDNKFNLFRDFNKAYGTLKITYFNKKKAFSTIPVVSNKEKVCMGFSKINRQGY